MDITIVCDDIDFRCSYSYWNKIRTNIIKASIDYISNKFIRDKYLYTTTDVDDEKYIGIGSYYDYYKGNIENMITVINEGNKMNFYYVNMDMQLDNTIKNFMKQTVEFKNLSSLNYFELGGLFALCNLSDFEGYYTPGNSLDICLLLDKIKFYMKKYEGYNSIYNMNIVLGNTIYDIFKNSHTKLINVSLC